MASQRSSQRPAHRPVTSVAEDYLAHLHTRGIEYLFANAGTDFAPVIEAMARRRVAYPEPVAVAHENLAVGMAHGAYLATGRMQAVMVHVNVGTANSVMGLLNAARDNVPVLFTAGRTPITETGNVASRDLPIHWGQEMFDQAGLLREAVKWDYELRRAGQTHAVVDRALSVAMSEPRGPVALMLPREVLADPADVVERSGGVEATMPSASPAAPSPDALAVAADTLARARRPLIISTRASRYPGASEALGRLATELGAPVIEFWPSQDSLDSEHPMHGGGALEAWLAEADVALCVDALVPFIPSRHDMRDDLEVVHVGPDPLFMRTPMRGMRPSQCLTASPAQALPALLRAVRRLRRQGVGVGVERRRERVAKALARARGARHAAGSEPGPSGSGTPMPHDYVSWCIGQTKHRDAAVFGELGCNPSVMPFRRPASFFSHSPAGGLGWGVPAALGAKTANREREVIACVGDGSYLFANPLACHQAAAAHRLPILTVVFNNARWDAVRKSTLSVYPTGAASRANRMPFTAIDPAPDYAMAMQACGGYAEQVTEAGELPAALARALDVVRNEGREALLDVVCA